MKRYISAILVPCFLLQLFGCYSMEQLTSNYQNDDNIEKVILKSKAGEIYTFEKFTSSNQIVKEPSKLFYTDYSFQDSNFIIVGKKFNSKENYKEKVFTLLTDTLIYNLNKLESIGYKRYNSTNTELLIGGILAVGLIVGLVIAVLNIHWDKDIPIPITIP